MWKDTTQTIYLLGTLILISYCTIMANNEIPNLDIMEIRNIVTAREMVVDNNWLIPTMNGEVRIAKPPLPTWLTALPIIITGSDDNLRALRVPADLAAILMVFFVYFCAKALSGSSVVSFLSATVAASSEFLIIMGKRASWDIFCHTFMLGAICLLLFGWKKEKNSLGLFLAAGLLMGLSFLSKGPIAFHSLLLPFLLSYIYVFGYKRIAIKWRGTTVAIVVCSMVAVLWPLYLYLYLPDTAITVGANEIHTWVAYKAKPLWYYLPFPLHAGIWVCLLISALIYPLVNKNKHFLKEKENYTFVVVWIFLTVVLLTLIPKKSTHYLLPVIIPVSLLIGQFMQHLLTVYSQGKQTTFDRITVLIHEGVVLLLGVMSFGICLYNNFWIRSESGVITYFPLLVFSGIVLVSYFFYKKGEILKLFITTVVLVCFICLFIPPIVSPMIDQKSFMALKMSRKETEGRMTPIYSSYEMGIKEIWAVGDNVKERDIDSLEKTHEAFAYFSKQHPDLLFHDNRSLSKRIQSTKFYVDTHSNETWYLSFMNKI